MTNEVQGEPAEEGAAQPAPAGPQITVAPPGQLTVKVRDRKADVFYVFRVELDALAAGYNSPWGTFFGIALGVAVALMLAIFTTDLGTNRPLFIAGTIAFGFVTAALLVAYVIDLLKAGRLVNEIKSERKL